MTRNISIDVIKGLAIISVILLHSLSTEQLLTIGAPYHIWQAIPIFILLAGFNSLSSTTNKKIHPNNIVGLYKQAFIVIIRRILKPFLFVYLFQMFLIYTGIYLRPAGFLYLVDKLRFIQWFLTGGIGPGSYFIPVLIQHLLFFPMVYYLYEKTKYKEIVLFSLGLLAIFLEMFCSYFDISSTLYRLLFFRYIFAIGLGVYIFYKHKNKKIFPNFIKVLLLFISLSYITIVNYKGYYFPFDYPSWRSQHTLSYFYPACLLWLGISNLFIFGNSLLGGVLVIVGRASYHIFLLQMMWFVGGGSFFIVQNSIARLGINLFIPILLGVLFYKLEIGLFVQPKTIHSQ